MTTTTTTTIRNTTATATATDNTLVITFSDDTPDIDITAGIPTNRCGMLVEAAWELGRMLEHPDTYRAALAGIETLREMAWRAYLDPIGSTAQALVA